MGRATAVLRFSGGHLELAWPDVPARLVGVRAVCRVFASGARQEHLGGPWQRAGAGFTTRCGPVDLSLEIKQQRGALALEFEAVAPPSTTILEAGLRGVPEVAGRAPAWLLHNGYQSWDSAGVAPLDGTRATSWWTCGLAADGGAGMALAAAAATRHETRFDIAEGPIEWLQVSPRSQSVKSETLLVGAASNVREHLTQLTKRRRRRGESPSGWLSWYHHGPWVTAPDLLESSARLADGMVPGLEHGVVQLDDGWQVAYGDWQPNTKFPDLSGVCREIRRRGQTPGIWTAPFLVSGSSDIDATAPDGWFVKQSTSDARLVDERHTVFGPMHVLDPTRPAVRKHLEETYARLRAHGFRYFKIDFLYAGAYLGAAALRSGLRAIRRGCGGDAYILACGAPLLPVVGLVDGCRIGPDTCTPLYDFEVGRPAPTVFGDEILNVARNVAARSRLQSWFDTDPDVAIVGGNWSLGQARQLLTAVALCGGLYFLSDDFARLAPERLALVTNPELLAIARQGPATPDWEPDPRDRPPSVWRRPDGLRAVFNWTGGPLIHRLETGTGTRARDLWSGSDMTPEHGAVELVVEAQDVRLVRLIAG